MGLRVSIHIHPEGRMKPSFVAGSAASTFGVSIHIHPEGRMKPDKIGERFAGSVRVSIHIHPEGRMKLPNNPIYLASLLVFQSTSTPKGG